MEYECVPIIVVCCYLVGEVYKIIFKNNQKTYKYIPILMAIVGGILGVIMYLTNEEIICNAQNIWVSLGIGIISGVSATGTNQLIKQIFKKGED